MHRNSKKLYCTYGLGPEMTIVCNSFHNTRMSTDIAFGRNHGMKTLLVFTGHCQPADLTAATPETCPDYHCHSVAGILSCRP